jgi:hypothetical protein
MTETPTLKNHLLSADEGLVVAAIGCGAGMDLLLAAKAKELA